MLSIVGHGTIGLHDVTADGQPVVERITDVAIEIHGEWLSWFTGTETQTVPRDAVSSVVWRDAPAFTARFGDGHEPLLPATASTPEHELHHELAGVTALHPAGTRGDRPGRATTPTEDQG